MAVNPFAAALAREDRPGRALPRTNPIAAAVAREDVRGRDVPSRADRDRVLRDLTLPDSTGQQVDDTGNGGDIVSRAAFNYPTTLPPLSPEMLKAIEERRRLANRELAEAEVMSEDRRAAAELENVGRLLGIDEEVARQRRSGMQELAGRGVARSPMYANPFRRELARVQQAQIGESQQQLASTLDQLNVALNAARQRREQQLSQIAFDEAMARSNVNRLLGIA